jgi:beta-alanine degradation protein BauB
MKTRSALTLALAAGCGGFLLARVFAQSPAQPRAVNRVAFENEKVRVLDYQAGPRAPACGFGKHSHPAHLTILLTDAKVRVVGPDGKATVEDGKAGDMFWEPAATHEVEDVSGNNSRCYVIEIKDKDWKPSTGLAK